MLKKKKKGVMYRRCLLPHYLCNCSVDIIKTQLCCFSPIIPLKFIQMGGMVKGSHRNLFLTLDKSDFRPWPAVVNFR
jgi:hypothetical protein